LLAFLIRFDGSIEHPLFEAMEVRVRLAINQATAETAEVGYNMKKEKRMSFKNFFSLMLAGLFATSLLIPSAIAADLKVSGYVSAYFASVTNNLGSYGENIDVDSEGAKDSFGYTRTRYDEAELKFKGSADTPKRVEDIR